MKTALIKANHGNHSGLNRKWTLENVGTMAENKKLLKDHKEDIADGCVIVTQKDVDANFFDGGANGYFPVCLKTIFENK